MTADKNAERIERFKQKYGAAAIDNGMRLRPDDFLDEVEWRDRIDQHYTRSWLEFTYGGLFARKGLDERTRLLVSIAQFLALGEMEELERQIPSALAARATPREVLEIILQSTVYIGYVKASRGARICVKVLEKLGRLDEITKTQLPLEGRMPERSLEKERGSWPAAKSEEETALREALLKKYGWKGVSTRIRTQAHQGNESIRSWNSIDPDYLQRWFDFIYGELYPRGVIDDRTRLLMMVGICLALNEPIQLENHMRGAMLLGATAREVLEVIVQSTAYVGMPTTILMVRMLERVAKEENRLSELGTASS
ncbi:MAG TPA: carboxymuconolactone decarboxylase family protein [Burkholderiales bacterium]|nr:carboxymuconolactone decarboxylase family protein [Burkholderiales bacterium]